MQGKRNHLQEKKSRNNIFKIYRFKHLLGGQETIKLSLPRKSQVHLLIQNR